MKPNTPPARAIATYLTEHGENMLRFLEALGGMETPSSDRDAQHRLLDWLEVRLRQLGMYTVHVPGRATGGYLYARPKPRDRHRPCQLLLGHCDTVWPRNTLEAMPIRRSVLMTRTAISPRLATRTLSNIRHPSIKTRIGVGSNPLHGLLICGQFEITHNTSISATSST